MNVKPPLVSVLVPAYRAARFISETLESLARQTCSDWELVVLEDGRFDDTADIVKSFAARQPQQVRLLQNQSNQGVGAARNRLLESAAGDFIAFLDADDLWKPAHLQTALDLLESTKTDWHIGALDLIDLAGNVFATNILPPVTSLEALPDALLRHNFILTSSTVFKRAVFAQNLRFDPGLSIGEDLDLCIELARRGHHPCYGTEATLCYRKHPSSITADSLRFAEKFSLVFEKHLGDPLVNQANCRRLLRDLLFVIVRMTWRREPARARAALARLSRAGPLTLRCHAYRILLRFAEWRLTQ